MTTAKTAKTELKAEINKVHKLARGAEEADDYLDLGEFSRLSTQLRERLGDLLGEWAAKGEYPPSTTDPDAELVAEESWGRWGIKDDAGGVWHPDDVTADAIEQQLYSEREVLTMLLCRTLPELGGWKS